jgi:hypothetical protein
MLDGRRERIAQMKMTTNIPFLSTSHSVEAARLLRKLVSGGVIQKKE